MTLLLIVTLTVLATVAYLRRDRILSWLVDRTGVEDPPAVELVELDDDEDEMFEQIAARLRRDGVR